MRITTSAFYTSLTAASLLVVSSSLMGGHQFQETIELREQLNREYGPELLFYSFSAARKSCIPGSVRVTSRKGPLPAQLVNIEYWSGKRKYVKSASLFILLEGLKPLARETLTITYGKKKVPHAETDLRIKRRRGRVQIDTSEFGIRVPLGSHVYK